MHIHVTLLTIVLLLTGILTGMFSSVVGGGALVIVPLFVFLGIPLTPAIATMRLSALVQQVVTVAAFWKEHSIEWRSALWVGLWCMPGSYFGARLVLHINQQLLSLIVAVCMVLLLVSNTIVDKKRLARKKRKPRKDRWGILAVTGLLMGVYGGFYGAGFSTVLMMIFSLVTGVKLLTASGNSSVAAVLMAIPAALLFYRAGVVNWDLFWPVTVGGVIGSWIGVEEAAKFGTRWVHTMLILVVVASVLKLLL